MSSKTPFTASPPGRDLVVRLHTESGIYGTYTLSIAGYGGELTRQLFEVEMRKLVVGQDASMPRRLRRHLFDQTEYYGVSGLGVFGISVIDYCVWDILGKARDTSVAQLLGQYRTEIPAYGMVGWLNFPEDELIAQCQRAIDAGYRAVKIKVGAPRPGRRSAPPRSRAQCPRSRHPRDDRREPDSPR